MHRLIRSLAHVTALIGGAVLVALIAMTTLSIVGRSMNKFLHGDFFETQMTGFSQFLLDLGVGEINGNYELLEAGVAFAIHLGGPAALFWMLVTAALGMTTKFVKVTLSHKYREFAEDGTVSGGPMYYMKNKLGMKWMATLFAVAEPVELWARPLPCPSFPQACDGRKPVPAKARPKPNAGVRCYRI